MNSAFEQRQSDEQNATEAALKAATGPSCHALVNRLANCTGSAMVVGENRVLRIVGMQLAQRGLGDLFEDIYAAVLVGSAVSPGDGRRFLQAVLQS